MLMLNSISHACIQQAVIAGYLYVDTTISVILEAVKGVHIITLASQPGLGGL